MKSAVVRLCLYSRDERRLLSLREAMLPETNLNGKCTLRVERLGASKRRKVLTLFFESIDLVSLRASLNTNLRLMSTGLRSIDAVSQR